MPSCLIIVENLPVPFDRRFGQEQARSPAPHGRLALCVPKSAMIPRTKRSSTGYSFVGTRRNGKHGAGVASCSNTRARFITKRLAWKVFRRWHR